jgi:heterogeneous nuclear ribonucleoprotein R
VQGRTLRCSLSQPKHRLFVGNVPKGLSEDELRNIILEKGPGVVNIEMFKVHFGDFVVGLSFHLQ